MPCPALLALLPALQAGRCEAARRLLASPQVAMALGPPETAVEATAATQAVSSGAPNSCCQLRRAARWSVRINVSFWSSVERDGLQAPAAKGRSDAPNAGQRRAVLSQAQVFVAKQQTRAAVRQGFIAERELMKPIKRLHDPSLSRGRTVVALRKRSARRLARCHARHRWNRHVSPSYKAYLGTTTAVAKF